MLCVDILRFVKMCVEVFRHLAESLSDVIMTKRLPRVFKCFGFIRCSPEPFLQASYCVIYYCTPAVAYYWQILRVVKYEIIYFTLG